MNTQGHYTRYADGFIVEYHERWYESKSRVGLLVPSYDVLIKGIDVNTLAKLSCVKPGTVRSWLYNGRVKSWKEGSRKWVDVTDVIRFLKVNRFSYNYDNFIGEIEQMYRSIRSDIFGNVGCGVNSLDKSDSLGKSEGEKK